MKKQHQEHRISQTAGRGEQQECPYPIQGPTQAPEDTGHPNISKVKHFSTMETGEQGAPSLLHTLWSRVQWQWRQDAPAVLTPPTAAPGLTALPSNASSHTHVEDADMRSE